ncbi:MAG: FMN-dependent NADH-azoreductase [Achromobacter sp.]|uniref:FMN dependent NADH:quinone oxidoreductase n=1 Tax=Achromobacter pulmonis TaxID=1389932 RepID=A0A6S7EPE4_9BURK|nr:NAD(P)H-dependent oxidoreductase [Achromobacter pulmonis]MPT26696.1 FMN-dependent NADH-azoreductase [Achromobacter sp.]CAB3624045.1 FMN-dependent NADH-azoreductase [Achromobacter pulmonis]CAB3917285.1 FMN-dependent NADH-azoreductase [Achromobacter pulmonis]
MRLLHIVSSPRGPRSASFAITNAFLQAYGRTCPALAVDTLNLWEADLPEFDSGAIGAKYKAVAREPLDAAETAAWTRIAGLVRRFEQAQRIVVGVPMWNFGLPYKLKQLIDLVSQRGLLFSFDGRAYGPLLRIPRALVVHVRGQGHDPAASPVDPGFAHQADYLDFWLRFIGVQEVRRVMVEHTWDGRAAQAIEAAKAQAVALARDF